jgi:hypothetical protein
MRPRGAPVILVCLAAACSGSQREAPPPATAEPVAVAETAGAPAAATAPASELADAYRDTARRIIDAALADRGAWDKLRHLTDRVGARLSGSKALDQAVAWAAKTMTADGHENVRTEKVMVPHWVRGAESARITAPVQRQLAILGLGGTVGTPASGVTGEVVVVDTFKELAALGPKVKDKVVLYNEVMRPWDRERGSGYGDTVKYRVAGASVAARLGARAVLVRSLTSRSLRSPHTGTLVYAADAPKIPAAAVSTEDADLLARLAAGGKPVTVSLSLGARTLPDAESANVLGEIVGSDEPDEIVVLAAHIDSWDVGQGAHDDGTGCAIMMQALTVLRRLELRPRRTIRVVLYTNEENGLRGAKGYVDAHRAELANHVMAVESDSGGFAPRGFEVSGADGAVPKVREIASLLAPIGATEVQKGYSGADIEPMEEHGVPGLGLWVVEEHYFDYHHTEADTLDKVDPDELARGVAAAAVLAYVVADMPGRLTE